MLETEASAASCWRSCTEVAKMRAGFLKDDIEVPEKVQVKIEAGIVKVKGPQGEVQKKLVHPRVKIELKGKHVVVTCDMPRKREKALVGTYGAHIRNMFIGATAG